MLSLGDDVTLVEMWINSSAWSRLSSIDVFYYFCRLTENNKEIKWITIEKKRIHIVFAFGKSFYK